MQSLQSIPFTTSEVENIQFRTHPY